MNSDSAYDAFEAYWNAQYPTKTVWLFQPKVDAQAVWFAACAWQRTQNRVRGVPYLEEFSVAAAAAIQHATP